MSYDKIPAELKALRQWVCWKGEQDENGRLKKLPINPHTGGGAMSNNPDTWTDFETAVQESSKYSGIGFMFAPPYFGVDIDHIVDDIEAYRAGETNNIVSEFVNTLESYAEYSQSGGGIHIICRGTLPENGRRRGNVEMYQSGRYFIMTGNLASEYTEILDCTEKIKPLHEKYIGGGKEPVPAPQIIAPKLLDDRSVIDAALNSKQGAMFNALYHGQYDTYFNSQSEADMSFCNMLAFWCRCNTDQMDRIFRGSGLMRDKWDRQQSGSTYGKITIEKAVKECSKVYEPQEEYAVTIGSDAPQKIYTCDDIGNAERLIDAYREQIRYSYIDKQWYYYDSRRWQVDNTGTLERLADNIIEDIRLGLKTYLCQAGDPDTMEKAYRKHVKYSRSRNGVSSMITQARHHVPILPDQLDRHNHLLCTPNGILHLRTGALTPHQSGLFITKITHCEYSADAKCPHWIKFLNEIFDDDQEMIHYVQKAVGYSLTGSTEEQCSFFCYGTGRNGKTTFLDTISAITGDYSMNIQPETLMVKNNTSGANSDVARLKGARFVTSVEPNDGMRLNEGLVKQLTGGDKVTARFQYGREFEFTPEFKLWMGTNYKPIIRGTDVGIWRRIHLIPFSVQIPEDKVDKRLAYRLRQEFHGILRWAVEGCLLWQKEGLEQPTAVKDATKEYRAEMDVISAFLGACCTLDPKGREKASDLYQAYDKWATENNEYVMPSRKFGQEMGKRFRKIRPKNSFMYCGLTLQYGKPYQVTIGNDA